MSIVILALAFLPSFVSAFSHILLQRCRYQIVSEWIYATAHCLQEKSDKNCGASAEIWSVSGSNN